ncbi:LysM peptidoglycan-binding domain-containing protein [Bacillus sp. ISL-47]|nr:LysM peptidoglycan-binding domain-containing protein [Bacillus sp. ISL-47]MBT2706856.1 LysM peptidoglycan-binding domain-containing protein [Pseudomonas sp. ISL-84]
MQNFYTVRSGDTLYGISSRWGIPADSLIAANHLKPPYTIYIGQQLSVPPAEHGGLAPGSLNCYRTWGTGPPHYLNDPSSK